MCVVLAGSRTASHMEETKDTSDSSTRTVPKVAPLFESRPSKKVKQARVSFATDDSSSFDSTSAVSYSETQQHLGSQQEVQFRMRTHESQHEQLKTYGGTEGEFIRETLAFRAAMDYKDDESGELSTSYHEGTEEEFSELRKSHKATDRSRHLHETEVCNPPVSSEQRNSSYSSTRQNRHTASKVEHGASFDGVDWSQGQGAY